MISNKKYEKNEEIEGENIYLILDDPETQKKHLKLIEKTKALEIAKEQNEDLIKISQKDNLSICKIFDLDSFLYKKKKSQKKIKQNKTKIVKFSVNTDVADFDRKLDKIIQFVNKFSSVQVVIMRRKLKRRFHLISETQDKIIDSLEKKKLSLNCIKKDNNLLLNKKKC